MGTGLPETQRPLHPSHLLGGCLHLPEVEEWLGEEEATIPGIHLQTKKQWQNNKFTP